jgi:hypothetical protein
MRTTLNGKEVIARLDNFQSLWSRSGHINRSMKGLLEDHCSASVFLID